MTIASSWVRTAPTTDRLTQLEQERDHYRQQYTELVKAHEIAAQPPHKFATVIDSGEDTITLAGTGDILRIPCPDPVNYPRGTIVLIAVNTGKISGKVAPLGTGIVLTITALHKDTPDWAEVAGPSGVGRVLIDKLPGSPPLKVDDRVLVDHTGSVIVARLPREALPKLPEGTVVRWTDVGGQEEAKTVLAEIIHGPRDHPELYQLYKRRPTKGVLLYGPPGCGKTLLGKAASTAINAGVGDATNGFIYVKATEILDRFVGVSEANIRQLFAKARVHHQETGRSAVIFIDEADAILGVRGARAHMGMEATIVPTFLTEMDGLEIASAVVILATNRPDTLDPAVIREGRIDRKVLVNRPGPNEVTDLATLYFQKAPLADSLSVEEASLSVRDALFASEGTPSPLGKVASGSLVAGIVDRAASNAFLRDAAARATTPRGIEAMDIQYAIDSAARELTAAQQNHLHL